MANKVLEMAIAIKGKLDGGLSSSVSKASQELNKLSNAIKDQQAQYRSSQHLKSFLFRRQRLFINIFRYILCAFFHDKDTSLQE